MLATEKAWFESGARGEAYLEAQKEYLRLCTDNMHATTDHYTQLWPEHRREPPCLSTCLRMFGRTDEVGAAAAEWEATLAMASVDNYEAHVKTRAAFFELHPNGTPGLLVSFREKAETYFMQHENFAGPRKACSPHKGFWELPTGLFGFFFTGNEDELAPAVAMEATTTMEATAVEADAAVVLVGEEGGEVEEAASTGGSGDALDVMTDGSQADERVLGEEERATELEGPTPS
mmetsp:Transcript_53993/g.148993  ORF Transcript_53993/g.148993 Transcript_53993/m.148993 type:complete len:233 (+) Transcript_53993:253-951(+)